MKFKAPPNIRPTMGKVREALFSILKSEMGSLENLHCLDLFAGSGALGITALELGASSLIAVDNDSLSCKYIKENADKLGLKDKIKISKLSFNKFLDNKDKIFDLIFADPPYAISDKDLNILLTKTPDLMSENGIFVLELREDTKLELNPKGLQLLSKRAYGKTGLWFWKKL